MDFNPTKNCRGNLKLCTLRENERERERLILIDANERVPSGCCQRRLGSNNLGIFSRIFGQFWKSIGKGAGISGGVHGRRASYSFLTHKGTKRPRWLEGKERKRKPLEVILLMIILISNSAVRRRREMVFLEIIDNYTAMGSFPSQTLCKKKLHVRTKRSITKTDERFKDKKIPRTGNMKLNTAGNFHFLQEYLSNID